MLLQQYWLEHCLFSTQLSPVLANDKPTQVNVVALQNEYLHIECEEHGAPAGAKSQAPFVQNPDEQSLLEKHLLLIAPEPF